MPRVVPRVFGYGAGYNPDQPGGFIVGVGSDLSRMGDIVDPLAGENHQRLFDRLILLGSLHHTAPQAFRFCPWRLPNRSGFPQVRQIAICLHLLRGGSKALTAAHVPAGEKNLKNLLPP